MTIVYYKQIKNKMSACPFPYCEQPRRKKNPPRIFSKMEKNRNLWDDETNTKLKKVLFFIFWKVWNPSPPFHCWRAILQKGKSYWAGRLSTVDLLVLTSLDQRIFKLKILFSFFCKTGILKEEVTCTEPSPSVSIPCFSTLLYLLVTSLKGPVLSYLKSLCRLA